MYVKIFNNKLFKETKIINIINDITCDWNRFGNNIFSCCCI